MTVLQLCPACDRLVRAELTYEHEGGRLVSDTSACPDCGETLWSWEEKTLVEVKLDTKVRRWRKSKETGQLGLFSEEG
jgi:hydrogenase maturation factor HypF (carbamoyltransferase family)